MAVEDWDSYGFLVLSLWCNLYFMAYEIRFISRLVLLGRFDLINTFEHASRYIDDICILNALDILKFMDINQCRMDENPWWIYPLGLVEIKPEMSETVLDNPRWGIAAHFLSIRISIMNVTFGTFEIKKYDK